jgi:hypothetical protein
MFGFFVLTMISVVILSSANGIYQNCIYGLTALFPDKFTNAVIIGNNLCGIFVTLVLIVTLICKLKFRLMTLPIFSLSRCPIYCHTLLWRCIDYDSGLSFQLFVVTEDCKCDLFEYTPIFRHFIHIT